MPKGSATPYVAAAGAIAATWLIEQLGQGGGGLANLIPAQERPQGMETGLNAAAREVLACGVRRLSSVVTLTGAEIRRLPSGAGEDFVREYFIQRVTLNRALGDLAIPGITNRPKLTAACAEQWLELWLDAFETANARNPAAFALDKGRIVGGGLQPVRLEHAPIGDWQSAAPQGDRTHLGKVFERVRGLYVEAKLVATVPIAGSLVWIKARQVTEALEDFAGALDHSAFSFAVTGHVMAEALATLRRDLHPVRFVEKAADVVVAPIELTLEKFVGPVLAATLGAIGMTLLPWAVVAGATYYLVRRAL